MFPNSPFAVPVGSFQSPVLPPTTDPQSGDLVAIFVNCDWMPYIAGALQQLLLESTWKTATDDELNLVQQRAFNLIALFNCATAPSATIKQTGVGGCDCEDYMCCLRWNNGTLQTLVCGVWTDVPGGGPSIPPGQPGTGGTQPPAGGGTANQCGALQASGNLLLPWHVSSGDTIAITSASGAGWDGTEFDFGPLWRCVDGEQFVAGACVGFSRMSATDPLPTANHMSLILAVGGAATTYLPITVGSPTTIPSGISNAEIWVQVNDVTLGDNQGAYQICAQITNNGALNWTSVLDFTSNPYTGLVNPDFGQWQVGVGYVGTVNGGDPFWVQLRINTTLFELVSQSMTYNAASVGGGSEELEFLFNGGTYGTATVPVAGSGIIFGQGLDAPATNRVDAVLGTGTLGGSCSIARWTISGKGTKPANLP